jgi:hypothetical protein
VVINGVLYNAESDWREPVGSDISMAGQPGTAPTGMASMGDTSGMASTQGTGGQVVTELTTTTGLATGVYTATGIPTTSTTKTATADRYGVSGVHIWLVGLSILSAQLGSWEW